MAGPRGLSTGTIGVRGYRVVGFFPTGRKPKAVYVHRLVCEAFNGPPPFEGALVRHLDGDCLNNLAENLAWGTHADNAADAKRHGTLKNYGKLTVDQVREIKAALAAGGETYKAIGRRYGVTESCVYTIKKGKAWAWVQ